MSAVTGSTDYIGGIEYDAGAVTFIQTEEGRAVPNGSTSYIYDYYLADHLGNTRVTFDSHTTTASQIQKDDYYPFGMDINPIANTPPNNYLYNKKELQGELAEYDYGARFYDPVLARWNTIDLLASNHYNLTPYNYVMDNPILYFDKFGLDTGKVKPIVLKEVKITAKKKPQEGILLINFHRQDIDHGFKRKDGSTDYCNCPIFAKNYGEAFKIVMPVLLTEFGGEIFSEYYLTLTDEELLANLPAGLRAAYEAEVMNLQSVENELREAGASDEQIARTLSNLRREIGVKYKGLTPPDVLKKIYQRNLEKYGDKLGPSIDFLRGQGKSWDDIINSAKRTGGKDLGF